MLESHRDIVHAIFVKKTGLVSEVPRRFKRQTLLKIVKCLRIVLLAVGELTKEAEGACFIPCVVVSPHKQLFCYDDIAEVHVSLATKKDQLRIAALLCLREQDLL